MKLIRLFYLTTALGLLAVLDSCQSHGGPTSSNLAPPTAGPGKSAQALAVSSTAFQNGGEIPSRYTCDGANVSPPLRWSEVPGNTRSIALILEDPDAPGGIWTHWILFNLSPKTSSLPEAVPPQPVLAGGGVQGTNDFKKVGYNGPCPPGGEHHYYFRVYALDGQINLDEKGGRQQFLDAMKGHVLAQGALMGRCHRAAGH